VPYLENFVSESKVTVYYHTQWYNTEKNLNASSEVRVSFYFPKTSFKNVMKSSQDRWSAF